MYKGTIRSALLTPTDAPGWDCDSADVSERLMRCKRFTDGSGGGGDGPSPVHLGCDAEDPLPLPWRSEEDLIIGCYLCVTATRREQRWERECASTLRSVRLHMAQASSSSSSSSTSFSSSLFLSDSQSSQTHKHSQHTEVYEHRSIHAHIQIRVHPHELLIQLHSGMYD